MSQTINISIERNVRVRASIQTFENIWQRTRLKREKIRVILFFLLFSFFSEIKNDLYSSLPQSVTLWLIVQTHIFRLVYFANIHVSRLLMFYLNGEDWYHLIRHNFMKSIVIMGFRYFRSSFRHFYVSFTYDLNIVPSPLLFLLSLETNSKIKSKIV